MVPPKVMPPVHSAAASGTLPIEQTKLTIARNGPRTTFSTVDQNPCPVRNSDRQNDTGTAASAKPATTKPMTSSLRSIVRSLIVYDAASAQPPRERTRLRHDPVSAKASASP